MSAPSVPPDLLARVEAFAFDDSRPALSFARRLARENGWTVAHAERVIREYKRFAYLAVAAGHPVTPSEEVDQAWHLHLTYTRSYWKRFCGEVLGRELHHDPTRGGPAEAARHLRQYAETLASYERHFGEPPPRDIWPEADFAAAPGRWVDTSRYWLVPKPWRTPRRRPGADRTSVSLAAVVCVGPVAAAFNPLDFDGPTFLLFYGVVTLLAVTAGVALRFASRDGDEAAGPPEVGDPYEAAYLAGGSSGVLQAALTALVQRRSLIVTDGRLSRGPAAPPPDAPPIERELYDAVPESGADRPRAIVKALSAVRPHTAEYRGRLRAAGLVAPPADEPLTRRRLPAAIMAAVVLLGVVKIAVGISRDKPVAFLVIMTAFAGVAAVLFLAHHRLTARGRAALAALRVTHGGLNSRDPHGLAPSDAALLVGLFGAATLVGTPLMPIYELRRQTEVAAGGDGGSSGGGGGCGGDGGGGGGCGGGGCGGCGGG